jgi:hypothetical protein
VYDGEDISIDIATGGGLTALLTFAKVADGQGIVFLANPGQTAGFTFTYDLALTPVSPGVADLINMTSSFGLSSATGNGFAQLQKIIPSVSPCIALRNASGNTPDTCAIPPAIPNTTAVGDILSLVAPSGTPISNASFGAFSNLFEASFTPDQNPTPVPEPSSLALMGVGLAAVRMSRRRRAAGRRLVDEGRS